MLLFAMPYSSCSLLNLLRNENEIFVPHGPQNHENSTKTANFEGFLAHISHFGAFLLVFLPFFRFFDPLFGKIQAGRELSHVAAIIPNPGKTELAPPEISTRFFAPFATFVVSPLPSPIRSIRSWLFRLFDPKRRGAALPAALQTDPPPRPLRQTVFPVHAFRAFRDFRSFSPPFPYSLNS